LLHILRVGGLKLVDKETAAEKKIATKPEGHRTQECERFLTLPPTGFHLLWSALISTHNHNFSIYSFPKSEVLST
jgi:hypothetical protein